MVGINNIGMMISIIGCVIGCAIPESKPPVIVIDIPPAGIVAAIDDSVPEVVQTWQTGNLPSNMDDMYSAIRDMLSRDKCGCQKGDPICFCQ
jgi:hypothetical protein